MHSLKYYVINLLRCQIQPQRHCYQWQCILRRLSISLLHQLGYNTLKLYIKTFFVDLSSSAGGADVDNNSSLDQSNDENIYAAPAKIKIDCCVTMSTLWSTYHNATNMLLSSPLGLFSFQGWSWHCNAPQSSSTGVCSWWDGVSEHFQLENGMYGDLVFSTRFHQSPNRQTIWQRLIVACSTWVLEDMGYWRHLLLMSPPLFASTVSNEPSVADLTRLRVVRLERKACWCCHWAVRDPYG